MKGNCGECERRWFCDIDPDKCDEWPDPVPMTNADYIRAMTDEELALEIALIAGWDRKQYKKAKKNWCRKNCFGLAQTAERRC